jgi:hypothetical protein
MAARYSSIPHSFVPRAILKVPLSPHSAFLVAKRAQQKQQGTRVRKLGVI